MVAEASLSTQKGALTMIASLGIMGVAIWHLLRDDAPLLNLRTLEIDTFRAATFGFFVYALVVWSMPFLLPLLFQRVFEWSPVKSGAAVLWIFAGNIGIKPATTWMLNRFGFRANMVFATAGVAVSVAAFSLLHRETPFVWIAALAFISGVFRSIGFTAYNTIAFGDVEKGAQMREANALYATVQQLAGALGIVMTMLALTSGARWGDFLPGDGLANAYSFAFLVLGAIALVPFFMATRTHPTAGDHLRAR